MSAIKTIGLVKEIESPENPGAMEKRVALIPDDVKTLVGAGIVVSVETGAGEGVDFSDAEYVAAGGIIETADEIYRDKDMLLKFKGPALDSIQAMKRGTILFCMAHFHSYPERAKMLEDHGINVIAMEEVAESPKTQSDSEILGRTGMAEAIAPFIATNTIGSLRIRILGWSDELRYCVRRGSNRDPRSLRLLQDDVSFEKLDAVGRDALYLYDSRTFKDPKKILKKLAAKNTNFFDIAKFAKEQGKEAIKVYREDHPPLEYGLRRIQCLHETGMAGARYGVELLKHNKPDLDVRDIKAIVLGYGNVGQGAIHELYDQGIRQIHILGRTHTQKERMTYWLDGVDLIVNGAEQPAALRGKNFLINNNQVKDIIPDGSVIIDLVGGSPTNRSPVEPVLDCTFLTDPHFVKDGVTIAALWGWPMLGMMRETAIKYSGQITDVIIGKEKLCDGLDKLTKGVKRALVCGPHN